MPETATQQLESTIVETDTHKIRVDVETTYVEDQSDPKDRRYVFSYTITIRNEGHVPARLLTRHWIITDANGKTHDVRGDGVVGEQPVLRPGESFEYTSGTPLSTPSGIMVGRYQMETKGGEGFEIEIPAFSLDSPYQRTSLN